jgi:hypothetical protein
MCRGSQRLFFTPLRNALVGNTIAGGISLEIPSEQCELEGEAGAPARRVVALPLEGATGYPLAGVPVIVLM